ncbi:hypothetical protein Tco_0401349 [Tanacetum coccineum]
MVLTRIGVFWIQGGRNNNHRKKTNVVAGTGSFKKSGGTLNDANPPKEAVASFVNNKPVAMEMQSLVVDKSNTVDKDVGSYPPLPIEGTTLAGNTPGKSSYANVTRKPSGKKLNIRTLFTPGGNGIDVVVSVESIRTISDRFANTAYGFFLGSQEAYHVVANYVKNTWGKYELVRSMFSSSTRLISFQFSSIKELVAMLENDPCDDGLNAIATKLGTSLMLDSYTADMCMQSWGRCSSCKVFGHIHEECLKNTGAGEKKTVKKPSQTSRGVLVGPKMGFKPHKEYLLVPKKSTTSSSGNKEKGEEPTIEVSNSNPFDVLNSVNNDVEFGTNGGTTSLVNNRATSSGSSFMNVNYSSYGTTPIIEKIGKFEDLIISGQVILVDKDGNPLKKVEFPGEYDSEDEVASVDNDMAHFMEYERGFGTQSLLEQWRDSYGNGDYDDDPYDDDMYEGQDLSHELQAICDNLDIRVRGGDGDSPFHVLPMYLLLSYTPFIFSFALCKACKLRLLDNDGNPLVPTGIVESDSEVEVVFDETANLGISMSGKDGSDKGYGTNRLLEQWRDSYPNNDDYDPYDDDMYENHNLSEHLQSICDDLDITYGGGEDVGVGVEEMMIVSVVDGGDDVCSGVVMKMRIDSGWPEVGRGLGDGSDDVDGDEVMKMVRVACRRDGSDDVGCGGGWPELDRNWWGGARK